MAKLTYAVGDIHGRLDLLIKAVEAIEVHGRSDQFRVVTLGDYIDRGPDSRGVVEYLMANAERLGMICLKGNHEAMMVNAIRSGDLGLISHWMLHGGEETMKSYGWMGRQAPRLSSVPHEHLEWMADRPLIIRDRERVYVHAGLHPDRALHEQDEASCLWIQDRFLDASLDHLGFHVVHGHTPEWRKKTDAAEAELLAHRTNLDTGAYHTGVLSIGVFADETPGGPVELLKVRSEAEALAGVASRWRRS